MSIFVILDGHMLQAGSLLVIPTGDNNFSMLVSSFNFCKFTINIISNQFAEFFFFSKNCFVTYNW